ncbi:ornithine--oxo-acid transaminase [Ramlibacter alkalitolerans]|uniref:ornithine aminotransferase n=1 Tax=Ramlibacter alkalitolerans TaxID=2039631 RepID=A0ABS1JSH3_9BURK|nr:ornithine--oxo-acid transaminase [Ramlibacter alkalitolerans]MBL0427182.1 ornithine--oxo-acid transaminase [Ramlibacter alkalitolerans]
MDAIGSPASQDFIQKEARYGARNYAPVPVVVDHAKDCLVWDVDGKEYIDMMSAYSSVSHGHLHPRIVAAAQRQLQKVAVMSRAYYGTTLGPLLEKLSEVTGFERALPMNTGAEAVETAIKCARRWGHRVKGIPDGQQKILVARGNFHGRTTTIIGFSSEEDYRSGFGPFDGGFQPFDYGDMESVKAAATGDTCAVLIEPIQGEAGVIVPPPGFFQQLRAWCTRNQVLLIDDEVQAGLGRTGKWFAFEHEGIRPDALILGKALGGGLLPVSAFCADDAVMQVFVPNSHGSTFGGNALAAAVALEGLKVLQEEGLVAHCAEKGEYLFRRLREVQAELAPLIRDVRGRGLWIGVDIEPSCTTARDLVERLAAHGVLSKETHDTVIRFAPPLTIPFDLMDRAVDIFHRVAREKYQELGLGRRASSSNGAKATV